MDRSLFGETWPGALSRLLTIIGALAFSLLVVDRLHAAFWSGSDSPRVDDQEPVSSERVIEVKTCMRCLAVESYLSPKRSRHMCLLKTNVAIC